MTALLGMNYEGRESSRVYVLLCTILGTYCISVVAYRYFLSKQSYQVNAIDILFLLFIPSIILLEYLFCLINNPFTAEATNTISLFAAFSLPSIYIGVYLSKHGNMIACSKWVDIVMLIITVPLLLSATNIVNTRVVDYGGASYQVVSYSIGLCYGINLCGFFFGKSYKRFPIFQTRIMSLLCLMLLPLQVYVALLSGGRGGIVLIIINTIVLLYLSKYKIGKRRIFLILLSLVVFIIMLSVVKKNETSVYVENGIARAFSYMTSDGIDMSQTSGRDMVYEQAWELIKERPLTGYGLIRNEAFSPHNLFLNLWMQHGFLFLLFGCFILYRMLNRLIRIVRQYPQYCLLIPLSTYPFVMLMFSGEYMRTGLFWFTLSFVFCFSERPNKKIKY
jgi:O-antigen ligase